VILAGGVSGSLEAQEQYRVVRAENFRRAASASAPVLARLSPGALVRAEPSGGNWLESTVEGWIWAASVQSTTSEGYDLRVSASDGENLRATPNGTILARVSQGALLEEVSREGRWIRVRRTGWIWAASLEGDQTRTAESEAGTGQDAARSDVDSTVRLDRAVVAHDASLARVPEGDVAGSLVAGTPVKVLARSGEWVRVQTEGWVRESDLSAAADGVLEGVSGAEVRARPEEFEGRLLQWTLQYLSVQEADELRSEIPLGRQYMLARGPLPEAGFVYVVLPTDRVEQVLRLAPVAQVVVIGRLMVARSRYLGNPVLDLVDLAVREP
jgi:hypothetical protein